MITTWIWRISCCMLIVYMMLSFAVALAIDNRISPFTDNDTNAVKIGDTYFDTDYHLGRHNFTNNTASQLDKDFVERINRRINALLPPIWKPSCVAKFEYVSGSNFTANWAVMLSCLLTDTNHWDLQSYRRWISVEERHLSRLIPRNLGLRFAVKLKCSNSGSLSLPWPMKAKYLWYILADNCKILDFLQEFNGMKPYQDYIHVIEITNSDLEIHVHQFLQTIMGYRNITRQYYCGAETAEKIVLSNVTKSLSGHIPKAPQTSTKTKINDAFSRVNQDSHRSPYRCIYKHLRYLDESRSRSVSTTHVQLLSENSDFPVLEYYNFSHSRLRDMSIQFLEWRRKFPKMKYLDLSYNRIRYISGISDNGLSTDPVGVIDLRHNNITTLSKDDINTLTFQSETVFIDIRSNPINCDCKLSDLMTTIKNRSSLLLEKYDYILDMKCAEPTSLSGQKLFQVEQKFCEFIEVFSLVVPVVILTCCLVLLTFVLVVVIRYRKEVMILAYTRFHISLPCREVVQINKEYDAFICYSEQDMNFVIYNILPRLEEPENGPGFKICIHHRDFPIGGTIFDNIDSKVKASRHTVLILSNNFLRSAWCKCEFWAAFTESLTQKKRHLIMIITEDLDNDLIEPTMKRCLKTFTYLRTDDRLFWDKLVYSLSDKKSDKLAERLKNINKPPEVVDPENRHNVVIMKDMLDGVNNNRNIRNPKLVNNEYGAQENLNIAQAEAQIDIQDNDKNDIHDIKNVQIIGNNVRNGILNQERGFQDGEWVL